MLSIEIKGLKEIESKLSDLAKTQIPAGIMFALTKVGQERRLSRRP